MQQIGKHTTGYQRSFNIFHVPGLNRDVDGTFIAYAAIPEDSQEEYYPFHLIISRTLQVMWRIADQDVLQKVILIGLEEVKKALELEQQNTIVEPNVIQIRLNSDSVGDLDYDGYLQKVREEVKAIRDRSPMVLNSKKVIGEKRPSPELREEILVDHYLLSNGNQYSPVSRARIAEKHGFEINDDMLLSTLKYLEDRGWLKIVNSIYDSITTDGIDRAEEIISSRKSMWEEPTKNADGSLALNYKNKSGTPFLISTNGSVVGNGALNGTYSMFFQITAPSYAFQLEIMVTDELVMFMRKDREYPNEEILCLLGFLYARLLIEKSETRNTQKTYKSDDAYSLEVLFEELRNKIRWIRSRLAKNTSQNKFLIFENTRYEIANSKTREVLGLHEGSFVLDEKSIEQAVPGEINIDYTLPSVNIRVAKNGGTYLVTDLPLHEKRKVDAITLSGLNPDVMPIDAEIGELEKVPNGEPLHDLNLFPPSARKSSSNGVAGQVAEETPKKDVFVSYASEDQGFATALVDELKTKHGLSVWFAPTELRIGDSLRESIEAGLAKSNYGVVILSHSFFAKKWPTRELNGLFAKELKGKKVILPIRHNFPIEELIKVSPMLSDKLSLSSEMGVEKISTEISNLVRDPR